MSNIKEIEKQFKISKELKERFKKEGLIDENGNIKPSSAFLTDSSGTKVVDCVKTDDKEKYLNCIAKYLVMNTEVIIDSFFRIVHHFNLPSVFQSEADKLIYLSLKEIIKKLNNFFEEVVNDMEKKYGKSFFDEIEEFLNNVTIEKAKLENDSILERQSTD